MAADSKMQTVQMVVDYGDGVQVHFNALSWKPEMTVVDALIAAQAHPHGVSFRSRGSAGRTLVTEIGGVKNEGGGQASRNWMFWVNEKKADVSSGAYHLKPQDAILWKFDKYDYNRDD
jgi:hypothetical protein